VSGGHTPGPWVYSFESVDPEWAVITTSGGVVIANVNDLHTQKANARLIAAAPDLLAALEEARPYVPDHHGPIAHKIDTAIAKARGLK